MKKVRSAPERGQPEPEKSPAVQGTLSKIKKDQLILRISMSISKLMGTH
ncbi:MAG: hypothetical protein ACJAT7_003484 [Psychromonas sp.]|jgi:hypothetical protein